MKSLSQNNECFIICHKIFFKTIKLPGRSVSRKALDEEGHGYNKANAHEKDAIPIGLKKNNLRGVSKFLCFSQKESASEKILPSLCGLTVTH